MKKQMSMDTTDAIISDVEKNYECVIEKHVHDEKRHKINLPDNSVSSVNDNEVKLTSGPRITVVVGDLAQQTVCLNILTSLS